MATPDIELRGDGALVVTRMLPASVDRVWRYLTERELMATWIADGEVEPRLGGRVALSQVRDALPVNTGGVIHGVVTACEPPRALAFTWRHDLNERDETHVRFDLEPRGAETLLTITHTRAKTDLVHYYAAGWQVHTDFMERALLASDRPLRFLEAFPPLLERYAGLPAAVTAFNQVLDGWNRHDADAMTAPLAEACLMIGFDGSEMRSRQAVEEAMRTIWADHQTRPYVSIVRSVRSVAVDACVLHAVTALVRADGQINAATNAVTTLTLARQADGWRVALYQNTPAAYHGRPDAAAALTAELQAATIPPGEHLRGSG